MVVLIGRGERMPPLYGFERRVLRNLSGTAEALLSSQFVEAEAFIFCKYTHAYIGRKEYK